MVKQQFSKQPETGASNVGFGRQERRITFRAGVFTGFLQVSSLKAQLPALISIQQSWFHHTPAATVAANSHDRADRAKAGASEQRLAEPLLEHDEFDKTMAPGRPRRLSSRTGRFRLYVCLRVGYRPLQPGLPATRARSGRGRRRREGPRHRWLQCAARAAASSRV